MAASVVPADAEAVADAVLDSVDGGIEVTATVSAPWKGECRRCLKPVDGRLRCEVREMYRPRAAHERPEDDEETYAAATSDHLDLEPLVRDALLLELPSPRCAGRTAWGCARRAAPTATKGLADVQRPPAILAGRR